MSHTARFRFYAELNDFLPPYQRQRDLAYRFHGKPSIKDAIEAIGVPHPEVDLILVNGIPVGFGHHLRHGDSVSVYPVFESFDISPVVRLRKQPLRCSAFITDVNLGKLARSLRMLGFDTLYRNDYTDAEVVMIAAWEHRIILTRDRRLLTAGAVTHGYWVRSPQPDIQVEEVLRRFDLYTQIRPFLRCLVCNGELQPVDKRAVMNRLQPKTRTFYEEFYMCGACEKIYWKGSHYEEMRKRVERIRDTGYRMQGF